MQLEAIYNQGKLEFIDPIQLKHERIRMIVQIPDEAIIGKTSKVVVQPPAYELPSEVMMQVKAMEERMDQICNAPLAAHEDLPPLTEKQQDRINTFALRDEIRSLR